MYRVSPTQRENGNDIALFFKRFIAVFFASNKDTHLLKWIESNEHPVVKSIDIAYDEYTIGEYYYSMKLQNDCKRIIGCTRILTSKPFWKTKRNTRLFDWIQTNNIWIKPTIISSIHHVQIRWLRSYHPTYTNYARATQKLLERIGVDSAELDLLPHKISHTMTTGATLKMHTLKVMTTVNLSEAIMDRLIRSLAEILTQHANSATAEFKLIPFQMHSNHQRRNN